MVTAADVLLDFVETCVHTILYSRNVYPAMLFEQRARYGANCFFFCRHRPVADYVTSVLGNAKALLEAGLVDRFVVGTFDAASTPLDHIAVDVSRCVGRASSSSSSSSSSSGGGPRA